MVDNYLILSMKSTRELTNCRPLEFFLSLTESTGQKTVRQKEQNNCFTLEVNDIINLWPHQQMIGSLNPIQATEVFSIVQIGGLYPIESYVTLADTCTLQVLF